MNWQERITKYFTSKGSLYIVSDEHELLREKPVQEMLQVQNSTVHFYDDPVVFRYVYETTFRHIEKEQRPTLLIVIKDHQFNHIPYDVYINANRLTLSFETLFPNFDRSIVAQCPIEMFQALFEAHTHCLTHLSINDTADFILREVCILNPALLLDNVSVVKAALHYFKRFKIALPNVLIERLKQNMIKKRVLFSTYVFECFASEEELYSYLNKQWKNYLEGYLIYSNEQVAEKKDYYGNIYFEDPFIRRYMRDFILAIEVPSTVDYEKWMQPGIVVKEVKNEHFDVNKNDLFQQDYSSCGRTDWVKFASELGFIQSELLKKGLLDNDFKSQISIANEAFEQWMLSKYQQLRTLPVVPKPKMVHQIPHYLSKKTDKKLALIVLDGMSFTQWNIIKETLLKQSWSFEEDAVFTWVPSLTSVSRQAIFSGLEPRDFADTIGTTRKEKTLWSSFWKNEGLSERNVAYEKSLGLKTYNKETLAYRHSPSIRVYGAVIDVIDQFMHGAVQGSQTVFSELTTWLNSNYLHKMLTDLVEEDFEVYLTSDHGNVECYGMGRLQEGVTVESKGERVRIYSSLNIRNQTASENKETIPWEDISLPSNYHVLLAKNNRAFVPKNDKIVSHGGVHIEEIIVPFVKINR
ncbi:BREX-3 system phosphatase PglZ [Paenisporosarcina sp. TG20]|uniref:BREX-3 system phosphatase PglZ n=1 Tax=Paenisporosarcina sp. TG20 TaxID=1211706 RepID=UPI0002E4C796|nr:BREX-3 system phosphatase PglZ [Paenisporosarcina sp. TG20]